MAEAIPVGAPAPRVRRIELDRPWAWLAAGWRDMTRAPAVSLAYGVLFAVIGWAVTFGLWWADMIYLILPLTAGFLIMGPILAVGLYEVSRRHEQGRQATLGDALAAFRANPSQIAFMGVTLLLLFFAWIRVAVLIFFLFFGLEPPNPEAFVGIVFFSAGSLPFLIVGTVGGRPARGARLRDQRDLDPAAARPRGGPCRHRDRRELQGGPRQPDDDGVLGGADRAVRRRRPRHLLPRPDRDAAADRARQLARLSRPRGVVSMQDDNLGAWGLGIAMALLSLLGLVLASAATDRIFYGTGFALFLFGVLFIFGLIHRHVGR